MSLRKTFPPSGNGKPVRFYENLVKDRKVVINFMYTTCADGTCPITTANLVQVQKLLGDRVGRKATPGSSESKVPLQTSIYRGTIRPANSY